MGYSGEAPMESAYRDARISRIYEGTNEINRILLVGMLFKSAMTGKLDMMGPGMALTGELKAGKYDKGPEDDKKIEDRTPFVDERWMLTKLKKSCIMILGSAGMKFMKKLSDE